MAGKLTRRDFLRRVGFYSMGVAIIGARDDKTLAEGVKLPWAARLLCDSLGYALQLSRLRHGEIEIQTAAADAHGEAESVIS